MEYTEQNRLNDFYWFLANYDDLFDKYGDSYLFIKDKKILGSYDTVNEGVEKIKKVHPLGTFIVQHCNGNESGYTATIASNNFMGVRG